MPPAAAAADLPLDVDVEMKGEPEEDSRSFVFSPALLKILVPYRAPKKAKSARAKGAKNARAGKAFVSLSTLGSPFSVDVAGYRRSFCSHVACCDPVIRSGQLRIQGRVTVGGSEAAAAAGGAAAAAPEAAAAGGCGGPPAPRYWHLACFVQARTPAMREAGIANIEQLADPQHKKYVERVL